LKGSPRLLTSPGLPALPELLKNNVELQIHYNILVFKAFLGFKNEGKSLIDGETGVRKFLKAQGMAFFRSVLSANRWHPRKNRLSYSQPVLPTDPMT
jgi:hypothetical protein